MSVEKNPENETAPGAQPDGKSKIKMDKWLVRTERNLISGPFPREKIRQMILKGELSGQDEVCEANSYWIYLHETDEVLKQLSVVVPKASLDGEKGEETETEIELRVQWDAGAANVDAAGQSGVGTLALGEVPELGQNVTEETAVLSNRALREFQGGKSSFSSDTSESGQSGQSRQSLAVVSEKSQEFFRASVRAGGPERPSFWRGFAVVLVAVILVLLLTMVWVLSSQPK